jgi:hypothetical protein
MPGRLCDIDFLGGTRTMASGWTSPYLTHHPVFTSAAEAVTMLRDGWRRLREAIERADNDQLEVTTRRVHVCSGAAKGAACAFPARRVPHPAAHFIAGIYRQPCVPPSAGYPERGNRCRSRHELIGLFREGMLRLPSLRCTGRMRGLPGYAACSEAKRWDQAVASS